MQRFLPALLVALAYLVPALRSLDDYGPTLDAIRGDYPFGERLFGYLETGDARFLDLKAKEPAPEVRSPHPDFDVGRYPGYWICPVGSLLSAASCRLFWTELELLPAMSAHNLSSVLLAAILVFVVSAFATARLGLLAGVVAGCSIFLTPSFFAHSFNNPKDAPECCFYTFAVLAGLHAAESGRARPWLWAGALTGVAMATKQNALFLPVQLVAFLVGCRFLARKEGEPVPHLGLRGFLLGVLGFLLAYYVCSPPLWSAPVAGPSRWVARVLEAGRNDLVEGGPQNPWAISLAAPRSVLDTTPLITLALALWGLLGPGLSATLRCFLLVSLAVPIGRNLLPGMRNFDGTRHFLEFLPMLALLAGAGAASLAAWLGKLAQRVLPGAGERAAAGLIAALAVAAPAWAVLDTHPNQVAYFNALAGGLGGAQAKGNPDASDFWGNSYWQGMAWLSAQAEPDARVLVPFRDYVARSGAPVRLRADIRIQTVRTKAPPELPLYVMHLVNKGLTPFLEELERVLEPVHEIRVQNGSVLHIHRLASDGTGAALLELWKKEKDARSFERQLLELGRKRPDLSAALLRVHRSGSAHAEMLEQLRALVPAELFGDLEAALQSELEDEPR